MAFVPPHLCYRTRVPSTLKDHRTELVSSVTRVDTRQTTTQRGGRGSVSTASLQRGHAFGSTNTRRTYRAKHAIAAVGLGLTPSTGRGLAPGLEEITKHTQQTFRLHVSIARMSAGPQPDVTRM